IAASAGSSAGALAWAACAQPARSRWPSVIYYLNTPSLPTTLRGTRGGAPYPPNPLTPGAFGTPNYQNGGDPSKPTIGIPGNSSGRQRAGPLAASGRIS